MSIFACLPPVTRSIPGCRSWMVMLRLRQLPKADLVAALVEFAKQVQLPGGLEWPSVQHVREMHDLSLPPSLALAGCHARIETSALCHAGRLRRHGTFVVSFRRLLRSSAPSRHTGCLCGSSAPSRHIACCRRLRHHGTFQISPHLSRTIAPSRHIIHTMLFSQTSPNCFLCAIPAHLAFFARAITARLPLHLRHPGTFCFLRPRHHGTFP